MLDQTPAPGFIPSKYSGTGCVGEHPEGVPASTPECAAQPLRPLTASRSELLEQIAHCADLVRLRELVSLFLGCNCVDLKVEPPVWCALGQQVSVGKALYLSAGCEIWDDGPIRIGDCVVCGPRVKIRAEPGRPVIIGNRVWLGEGVEIAPGSHIGDNAVVCAGSYIAGEVSARTVVSGNPSQVIRHAR